MADYRFPTLQGASPENFQITAAVNAGALTVALKTLTGDDPSPTSPITIAFRDASLLGGNQNPRSILAATSLVIPSGATLGTASNTPFRLWVVGLDDAGTVRLGLINCLVGAPTPTQIVPLAEHLLRSSIAASSSANSAGVVYTTPAVTSKPLRIFGYLEWGSGLAAAGTWDSAPTQIQRFGPGVKKPGETVQAASSSTNTQSVNAATTYANTNSTISLAPTSAANPVNVNTMGPLGQAGASSFGQAVLARGGTPIGYARDLFCAGGTTIVPCVLNQLDMPGTTANTTWTVQIKTSAAANCTWATVGSGDCGATMSATEIMG